MENETDIDASGFAGENNLPIRGAVIYPPKPELEESKSRINVWIRSLSSLALYFIIGYFFFNKDWLLVLVLTGVVVFHELGHFLAMKFYNYTELGIFFIPLLGAYASGTKREVSQTQSAIIILAGPVPGILIGTALYFLASHQGNDFLIKTAEILVYLNLLNLIPIYPLDGGQLLNRLFLDESAIIGKIFVVISSLLLAWFFVRLGNHNSFFYGLLLFPLSMLSRLFSEAKQERLVTRIENEGIDLNTTYDDITDEQYWKIRHALIKHHPDLVAMKQAPPYEYAEREDKIVTVMQSLLQRIILIDLSLPAKLIILFIWIGCFAAPMFVELPFGFRY